MKNFIINLLLSVLAIVVSSVVMTAVSSVFAESFIEVINNFVGSFILLSTVAVVTLVIALLIKGIKALFNINIKRSKPFTREYSFNIWMKYWSERRQKLLTTVTVEASTQTEAEDKIRERYSKLLYDLERI